VKLSQETQSYLAQNLEGRDLVRLNRSLLQDAFPGELAPRSEFTAFARLWQLTNTRLILGMSGFLDLLNQQMDPIHRSFRVKTAFDFASRGTLPSEGGTRIEEITTVIRPEGQFAILEFGAALPRAKLYTEWQVVTNEHGILQRLADPSFDPQRTVLVAAPLPEMSGALSSATGSTGTVSIVRFEPKRISLEVQAAAPSVLLLNDKFDPNWQVTVDGKPETLLRCNYIMRGVHLGPGQHRVEFEYAPPHFLLFVSLAGILVGATLCGILAWDARTPKTVVKSENR
jgi:hypothetical protein